MNTITLERHPNNDTRLPWRVFTYDMTKANDIAKYVAREKYAWPGGYELYAICDDGGVLCHECCRNEFYNIATSYAGDGWRVVAAESTAMCDMDDLHCDQCNKTIYEYEV